MCFLKKSCDFVFSNKSIKIKKRDNLDQHSVGRTVEFQAYVKAKAGNRCDKVSGFSKYTTTGTGSLLYCLEFRYWIELSSLLLNLCTSVVFPSFFFFLGWVY